MIPPRPPEYERGREHFKIRTSPVFDGLAPAEAAAEHTLGFLFNAERAARLVEFHSRNGENPGLEEVLDVILRATWKAPHGQDYNAQIAGVVDNVALYDLMALVANDHASEEVRAISSQALDELYVWLNAHKGMIEPIADQAHISFALRQIEQFRKDPKKIDLTPPAEPPDGQPIGTDDDWEWPN